MARQIHAHQTIALLLFALLSIGAPQAEDAVRPADVAPTDVSTDTAAPDLSDQARKQGQARQPQSDPEYKAVADAHAEADRLWAEGSRLKDEGDYLAAAEAFVQAAEAERASGQPRMSDLAAELSSAGTMYQRVGRHAEAEPLYREALAVLREALPEKRLSIATALNNLAECLEATDRHAEAEPLYREALTIRREVLPDGHPSIALALNDLAELLSTTGRQSEAEALYREAAAILRPPASRSPAFAEAYDRVEAHKRADRYWKQGKDLEEAGDFLAAAQAYEKAAEAERASGRPRMSDLAAELNSAGNMYRRAGSYAKAEPLYREALVINREALPKDHPGIARSLNNLAVLLETTARYAEAEPLFREALSIFREAAPEGHPVIASSLDNLAALLDTTGRYAEAELLYREALGISRKALPKGHPDITISINNLAILLGTTGRYAEAEPLLREALTIQRETLPEEHPGIARGLNNLAGLLLTTSRYAQAEPLLREALTIDREALPRDHPDIAESLNNLARLLESTGRYAEAEPLFHEALAIYRKALPEGHPDIATSLNNLASLLDTTGRYAEAELLFREALAIDREALPEGHPGIATDLNNLGGLLLTTGRYAEAEPLLREALTIDREALPEGHPNIAYSLNNLARLLQQTERTPEAEPLLHEALRIAQAGGEPAILWHVQGNLSDLYTAQTQRPLGIFFGKQAVNTLQSVRQELSQSEQTTQQAFLQSKEGYYKDLADWLMAEGRLPEAQQVLEMLKEQEYFEFLQRDPTSDPRQTRATLNAFEVEQAARIDSVSAPLVTAYQEAESLRRIHADVRTAEQVERLQTLEATLAEGRAELGKVFEQVQTAFAALSAERQQQLTQALELDNDRRALVRALGPGVALVQYLVLEDQLRVLLTTADEIIPISVPMTSTALNQAAATLYHQLRRPDQDPRAAARRLDDALIAPLEPRLQAAGIHTLMFELDGVLRYLPLAALHDGQRYLAERYALALHTAAADTELTQQHSDVWQAVGLGVSLAHPGFNPLPAVPEELEGIIRREDGTDADGVLPGAIYLDDTFTAIQLRQALARGYPVVHLSSHFAFRPGNETQSFLLLGDGSQLDLHTLRTGDYSFADVDLVTLSACETALDSPDATGKEIEGLATLVQKQGANGVIATLWPVADASTGEFMQRLYRLRQEQGLSKAEALRQAQLGFLRGTSADENDASADKMETARKPVTLAEAENDQVPSFTPDPEHPYAHPFYWAPFILMGNWL